MCASLRRIWATRIAVPSGLRLPLHVTKVRGFAWFVFSRGPLESTSFPRSPRGLCTYQMQVLKATSLLYCKDVDHRNHPATAASMYLVGVLLRVASRNIPSSVRARNITAL